MVWNQGMMMGGGMDSCGMMGMHGGALHRPADRRSGRCRTFGQWRHGRAIHASKLGAVTEQKDGTITADITTQEGSLVQKLVIDRTQGLDAAGTLILLQVKGRASWTCTMSCSPSRHH